MDQLAPMTRLDFRRSRRKTIFSLILHLIAGGVLLAIVLMLISAPPEGEPEIRTRVLGLLLTVPFAISGFWGAVVRARRLFDIIPVLSLTDKGLIAPQLGSDAVVPWADVRVVRHRYRDADSSLVVRVDPSIHPEGNSWRSAWAGTPLGGKKPLVLKLGSLAGSRARIFEAAQAFKAVSDRRSEGGEKERLRNPLAIPSIEPKKRRR
jgi:hypothetical protein